MSFRIVNVEVAQQVASAPNRLQQTGAIVTQGGTTTPAGTLTLITKPSDLSNILAASIDISSITWLAGVVSVVLTSPHGVPLTDVVVGTITDVIPTGYNGEFEITSTGANTFTYPLIANPGIVTQVGSFVLGDAFELGAQVGTFFAQSANTAVYILELGIGTVDEGVVALQNYINAPTVQIYAYLLPDEWDDEPTFAPMANLYSGNTALLYFYITTKLTTYNQYVGIKSIVAMVQSPNAPSVEASIAAMFQLALATNPNASNMMLGMQYRYVTAVTPYLTLTPAQEIALTGAGVNWIGTGAEGQISNTIIFTGGYMDRNPFTYWYTVDWVNTHQHIGLAAAIINGSNRPQNPLYYNQDGINYLQKVAQQVMNTGTSFGLLLAGSVVNAVPFAQYVLDNPSDYAVGVYNGLSCTFVPARGFTTITIYLTASNIPTSI